MYRRLTELPGKTGPSVSAEARASESKQPKASVLSMAQVWILGIKDWSLFKCTVTFLLKPWVGARKPREVGNVSSEIHSSLPSQGMMFRWIRIL